MSAPGFASPKAIARFRLLQLHLEKDIPLARIAAEGGIAERTLRRWLAVWRAKGIAGLERSRRSDAGITRRLAPEIEALVRSMATRRPRPTAPAIHRKVQAEAKARGLTGASYSVVAGIVRGIEPARIAVATDAATNSCIGATPMRPTRCGRPIIPCSMSSCSTPASPFAPG